VFTYDTVDLIDTKHALLVVYPSNYICTSRKLSIYSVYIDIP